MKKKNMTVVPAVPTRQSRPWLSALLAVLGVGVWLLASAAVAGPRASGKEPPVDYARDVLPILAHNCFTCHGPDKDARKAGLRLDLRDQAVKAARSGEVPIRPGKATDSDLIRRIHA